MIFQQISKVLGLLSDMLKSIKSDHAKVFISLMS